MASPARIQHYFGDHDSCRAQRTPRNGCLDWTTTTLPSEEDDSPKGNNSEKLFSKREAKSILQTLAGGTGDAEAFATLEPDSDSKESVAS